ncbi:uncharacterized protein LOC112569491 [Pomacea canaliculata]|uniref:uncharacterized protein LOC112569491 n=1 Tax=Pomacea canaliculata TaxID=400727 RepID=UPI000D72C487|nr:uncharacterized protein LOC112569491 [Pomacea canaliculata]
MDVGIICDFSKASLHLTGHRDQYYSVGRVEVDFGSGQRSTLCVPDNKTASVICKTLRLPSTSASLVHRSWLGMRKSPIFDSSFVCEGNESSIFDCVMIVAKPECYNNDVGILCTSRSSRDVFIIALEGYPFVEGTKNVLKCVTLSSFQDNIQWTATAGGRHVGDLLFFDNITREHNGRLAICEVSHSYFIDTHKSSSATVLYFELKVYFQPFIF